MEVPRVNSLDEMVAMGLVAQTRFAGKWAEDEGGCEGVVIVDRFGPGGASFSCQESGKKTQELWVYRPMTREETQAALERAIDLY